jgi:hypothetical protein
MNRIFPIKFVDVFGHVVLEVRSAQQRVCLTIYDDGFTPLVWCEAGSCVVSVSGVAVSF